MPRPVLPPTLVNQIVGGDAAVLICSVLQGCNPRKIKLQQSVMLNPVLLPTLVNQIVVGGDTAVRICSVLQGRIPRKIKPQES